MKGLVLLLVGLLVGMAGALLLFPCMPTSITSSDCPAQPPAEPAQTAPAPPEATAEPASPTTRAPPPLAQADADSDHTPGMVPAPAPVEPPSRLPQNLLLPIADVDAATLRDNYSEKRNGRSHDAIDIAAPKGTPVRAVDDGRVAKLFDSKAGGLTVYQFDPTETFAYYYAHLDGYASGLAESKPVARGEVIGYVGSTGNASAAAPHLHFAIFVLGPEKRWWQGTPINPFPLLAQSSPQAKSRQEPGR